MIVNNANKWRPSAAKISDNAETSAVAEPVEATHGWTEEHGRSTEAKSQADVYVFCHLKHKDPKTIDPLKLEQWDFYVISTEQLNKQFGEQQRIGLTKLKSIIKANNYRQLKGLINEPNGRNF